MVFSPALSTLGLRRKTKEATDEQGGYRSINAEGQFCQSCHAYTATKIDCFECHATKPAAAVAHE